MLLKSIAYCQIALLVSCATPYQKPALANCKDVAAYARTVAILRDLKVQQTEIEARAKTSKTTFPIHSVITEVYRRDILSAASIEDHFESMCLNYGYASLKKSLAERAK